MNNENNSAQWYVPKTQWQGNHYHPGENGQPPKDKKPKSNWKVIFIACICSCLVASAASVGGFAALVAGGVIPMGTTTVVQNMDGTVSQITANPTVAGTTVEEDTSTLQGAASKAVKSVVLIQAYSKSRGMSYGDYYGFNFGFGGEEEEQLSGEGSGVIATSDGYIITNAHVVDGASSLQVSLADGTTYDAKVIGSDEISDLALIKIDASNLEAAEFGVSGNLRVGDRVMAVGNPGGSVLQSSVTFGFVSALDRPVTTDLDYEMTCIQTDTAINPGNSGGALINAQGQVVGITSSKIVSTSYEGLGFAIPIDTALPIINDLRENGYVSNRAMLGITGQFLDPMTARYYGMATGYYVASVNNPSAKEAGLRKNDVIIKIDDTEIVSTNTLASFLAKKAPGDSATLTVDRDGDEVTMEITLQQYTV